MTDEEISEAIREVILEKIKKTILDCKDDDTWLHLARSLLPFHIQLQLHLQLELLKKLDSIDETLIDILMELRGNVQDELPRTGRMTKQELDEFFRSTL